MKRASVITVAVGLISCAVMATIAACGSDGEEVPDPDSGNASSTSSSSGASSGASSSGASSSGASSSGSSGTDGGDGGVKEGGGGEGGTTGSNPGKVTCGTAECATGGATICCEKTAQDGGVTRTCEATCDGFGSYDLRCDEKADCPNAADKCCLGFQGAMCNDNCGFGQNPGVQLCKTNAECGDAGACNVKTCLGRQRSVCGTPTGCQ